MRRLVTLVTLALIAIPALPARADQTVRIADFSFAPSTVTVEPGASITFENQGSYRHTSTSDDGFWSTGTIAAGSSAAVPFTSAGTFRYHCAIHASMHGVVVVGLWVSPAGPVTVGTTLTVTFADERVDGRTYVVERKRGRLAWRTIRLAPDAISLSMTPRQPGRIRFRATTVEGDARSAPTPVVVIRVRAG